MSFEVVLPVAKDSLFIVRCSVVVAVVVFVVVVLSGLGRNRGQVPSRYSARATGRGISRMSGFVRNWEYSIKNFTPNYKLMSNLSCNYLFTLATKSLRILIAAQVHYYHT